VVLDWEAQMTNGDVGGGTPGLTPRDVESRDELPLVLAGARFPATPKALAEHAAREGAPDVTVALLEELSDRRYDGVSDVAGDLSGGEPT
jgi:Protein of unknown function (DUF2795)